MYYKIVNKESEVYKKLHEMRTKELKWEEDNKTLINEKVGLEWDEFFGHGGQQNFGRVTEFVGFVFTEPEKVDPKVWKRSIDDNRVFVPNNRTKAGKEMNQFLSNGLNRHYFSVVFDCLGAEHPTGRFVFPYVEIFEDDIIIIYVDDRTIITDENVIEITSKEARSFEIKHIK